MSLKISCATSDRVEMIGSRLSSKSKSSPAVVTPPNIESCTSNLSDDNATMEESDYFSQRSGERDEQNGGEEDVSDSDSSDMNQGANWPLRCSKGNWTIEEDAILSEAVNSHRGEEEEGYTYLYICNYSHFVSNHYPPFKNHSNK
jgi:hypothetical protein